MLLIPPTLQNDLTKLEIHENHRMITLDIKDLYVNMPIDETLDIMKARLVQNNDTQITHHILSLLRAILSHNCYTFQQKNLSTKSGQLHGITDI
jgi:predicted transcriptional regulator